MPDIWGKEEGGNMATACGKPFCFCLQGKVRDLPWRGCLSSCKCPFVPDGCSSCSVGGTYVCTAPPLNLWETPWSLRVQSQRSASNFPPVAIFPCLGAVVRDL